MTERMNMKHAFTPENVRGAVESAIEKGLLCEQCIEKISVTETISQSDFCPSCQAAVSAVLIDSLKKALAESLTEKALPANTIRIVEED